MDNFFNDDGSLYIISSLFHGSWKWHSPFDTGYYFKEIDLNRKKYTSCCLYVSQVRRWDKKLPCLYHELKSLSGWLSLIKAGAGQNEKKNQTLKHINSVNIINCSLLKSYVHEVLLAEQQPSAGTVHSLCHSEVSRFGTVVPETIATACASIAQVVFHPTEWPVVRKSSCSPWSCVGIFFFR